MSGGGSLCRMVLLFYAERIEGDPHVERRPLCRGEKAPVPPRGGPCAAERRPLCRREEAPVPPREGPCAAERRPLCRREKALCRREEAPVPPRGGPCAERRPLCREDALCVGRSSVLRELEDAPVSGGGPLKRRPPWKFGTPMVLPKFHPW